MYRSPNVRITQLSGGEWRGFTISVTYAEDPPGYEIRCTLPGYGVGALSFFYFSFILGQGFIWSVLGQELL
jgi:hypothetical protein